jgi:hypothetical protein
MTSDAKVKAKAKALVTRLRNAGYRPRSYSGRGMFGAECVGVSLARGERLTVAASGASLDALGMGTIAYWRSHPWFPAADEVEETSDMGGAS